MSYATIGPDSDVYVFKINEDRYICRTNFVEGPFETRSPSDMIKHLQQHIIFGHKVPDACIERLSDEVRYLNMRDIDIDMEVKATKPTLILNGERMNILTDKQLWELVYECAGAATAPLMRDHPGYVFPSERVSENVRHAMASHGYTDPPEGYCG